MPSGLLSGLAGVYFEKILKGSTVSVWVRNIQLGLFGTFFSYAMMFMYDGAAIREKGILFGYTDAVWITIFVQSAGGLLVALVVKYADNILKGFATSAAIIISCLVSMLLFDFQLTVLFTLGATLVILSTFLYLKPELLFKMPGVKQIFKERSILI